MKDINLIGFGRANGTQWCHKTEAYPWYEDIALVKNNGNIVWKMDVSELPESVIDTIEENSIREKWKVKSWIKALETAEDKLKGLKENTKEYFITKHSILWHMEAIRVANI